MSDLEKDKVVQFQRRYYLPLVTIFSVLLPTLIPMFLFGESAQVGFFVCVILRYVYTLHW